MKKHIEILLLVAVAVFITGCGNKMPPAKQMIPMGLEEGMNPREVHAGKITFNPTGHNDTTSTVHYMTGGTCSQQDKSGQVISVPCPTKVLNVHDEPSFQTAATGAVINAGGQVVSSTILGGFNLKAAKEAKGGSGANAQQGQSQTVVFTFTEEDEVFDPTHPHSSSGQ